MMTARPRALAGGAVVVEHGTDGAGGLEQRSGAAPDRDGSGVAPARATSGSRRSGPGRALAAPDAVVNAVAVGYPALWITMFATSNWEAGLVMVLLNGPLLAAVRGRRRSEEDREDRAERRRDQAEQRRLARGRRADARVLEHQVRSGAPPLAPRDGSPAGGAGAGGGHDGTGTSAAGPGGATGGRGGSVRSGHGTSAPGAGPDDPGPERSLAASVATARSAGGRLDAEALALVEQLAAWLGPLLERARTGGMDPLVRRDLAAIATDHLPAALDAYLRLPTTYARQHRAADGSTPADALRAQLVLLLEGCREMREAVHGADVARQQELGRFLEAKFRRSDLDL